MFIDISDDCAVSKEAVTAIVKEGYSQLVIYLLDQKPFTISFDSLSQRDKAYKNALKKLKI